MHLLFVDTEEACGLDIRGGTVLLQPIPSAHSDVRVVTTTAALHALLTGRLSLAQARKNGVLIVEAEGRVAQIFMDIFTPNVSMGLPGDPHLMRSPAR